MARLKVRECEFKNCPQLVGPDGAKIGYEINGETRELKCCGFHAGILRMSQPGSFHITADRELKPRAAKPRII